MPKISALPPMTTADADDVAPIVNDSGSTTMKITLTVLKEWLQSLVGWITAAMLASDSVTATKIDWASTGADAGIWWEELGRTTLGSAGDTLAVTSFAARKHLRVLANVIPSGSINSQMRFNNDSGSNYAMDFSTDYTGTPAQLVSQTMIELEGGSGARQQFYQMDILNIATQAKLGVQTLVHDNATSSAATAPLRFDNVFKWSNTADQITRIDILNQGSGSTGDFSAGSELIILGHN